MFHDVYKKFNIIVFSCMKLGFFQCFLGPRGFSRFGVFVVDRACFFADHSDNWFGCGGHIFRCKCSKHVVTRDRL